MTIQLVQPRVTLVGKTKFVPSEDYKLTCADYDEVSDGSRLVEFAGRVCYMSFDGKGRKTNDAYIEHIFESSHGSVTEHAVYSVLIEGISRSCSHEVVRHRAGFSYSQLSQRYVDESDVAFIMPPELEELAEDNPLRAVFVTQCEAALMGYNLLVEGLAVGILDGAQWDDLAPEDRTDVRKRVRQTARSVLPNATETKLVMTGNVRAWTNFFALRGSSGADSEIRRLSLAILDVLKPVAHPLLDQFRPLPDGTIENFWPKP